MRAEAGRSEPGGVELARLDRTGGGPARGRCLRVALLRIALPLLGQGGGATGPVTASWRTADGGWDGEIFERLSDLGGRFSATRVEVCPHPSDLAMTEVEMPALPAKRRREAVLGAIELMTLEGVERLAVGFGPRGVNGAGGAGGASGASGANGSVPVGWMAVDALAEARRQLHGAGLAVDAILPPPAFLPEPGAAPRPDPNAVPGAPLAVGWAASAVRIDDWVVLRTGVAQGLLVPIPGRGPGEGGQAAVEEALRARHPDLGAIRWVADREVLRGTGWPWSLTLEADRETGAATRWAVPALGWTAAALAIGVAGLHLQAQRLAAEGRGLSRQMIAEVKAAFPEVPVVLNALQQARQMRDARRAGGIAAATPDVAAMLRSAAALLTQAQGQVQRIDAQDGQLLVRWREGAAFGQGELRALQARARQAGLSVEPDGQGLRIQVDPMRPAAAEIRSAQAPASPVRGTTP